MLRNGKQHARAADPCADIKEEFNCSSNAVIGLAGFRHI